MESELDLDDDRWKTWMIVHCGQDCWLENCAVIEHLGDWKWPRMSLPRLCHE